MDWTFWITPIILVSGIFTLILMIILLNLSLKIKKWFYGRDHILNGYIAIITNIIAYLAFFYISNAFGKNVFIGNYLKITFTSASLYTLLTTLNIINTFNTISEASNFNSRNNVQFIAVLFVQLSIFFITSSASWFFTYLGLLSFIFAIQISLRNKFTVISEEKRELIHTFFTMNFIAIVLLLFGLVFYHFTFTTFGYEITKTNSLFGELLSFILIINSLLIFAEVPPFHSRKFDQNIKKLSGMKILAFLQKAIAIILIFQVTSIYRILENKAFYFWFFLVLGTIYSLWGVLASITEQSLSDLLEYTQSKNVGFIFLFLASNFLENVHIFDVINLFSMILFFFLFIAIVYVFQTNIIGYLQEKYTTDNIKKLKGLGKSEKIITILLNLLIIISYSLPLVIVNLQLFYFLGKTERTAFWIFIYSLVVFISLIDLSHIITVNKDLYFSDLKIKHKEVEIETGKIISSLLSFIVFLATLIFAYNLFSICLISSFTLF